MYPCRFHPFTGHGGPQGEQRCSSTLFLTSAIEGGEGSASRPCRTLPPGNTRYPLYRRLGGPQGPVWTGAENLAPTGIRSPDRLARRQSLYRLSYRGPLIIELNVIKYKLLQNVVFEHWEGSTHDFGLCLWEETTTDWTNPLTMESKMCLMAFQALLAFKNALSRSRRRDTALQLSDTIGITECLLDQ